MPQDPGNPAEPPGTALTVPPEAMPALRPGRLGRVALALGGGLRGARERVVGLATGLLPRTVPAQVKRLARVAREATAEAVARQAGLQAGHGVGLVYGEWVKRKLAAWPPYLEPMLRALIDRFLVDRIMGAVWPAGLILGAVLGCGALSGVLHSPEGMRLVVSLVLLLALLWTSWELAMALRGAWPCLRRWLRHPRRPRAFAADELAALLEAELRKVQAEASAESTFMRAFFEAFTARTGLDAGTAAHQVAERLAGPLLRHLALRCLLLVAPLSLAYAYYRLVVYPQVVASGFGAGPLELALYPLGLVFGR